MDKEFTKEIKAFVHKAQRIRTSKGRLNKKAPAVLMKMAKQELRHWLLLSPSKSSASHLSHAKAIAWKDMMRN